MAKTLKDYLTTSECGYNRQWNSETWTYAFAVPLAEWADIEAALPEHGDEPPSGLSAGGTVRAIGIDYKGTPGHVIVKLACGWRGWASFLPAGSALATLKTWVVHVKEEDYPPIFKDAAWIALGRPFEVWAGDNKGTFVWKVNIRSGNLPLVFGRLLIHAVLMGSDLGSLVAPYVGLDGRIASNVFRIGNVAIGTAAETWMYAGMTLDMRESVGGVWGDFYTCSYQFNGFFNPGGWKHLNDKTAKLHKKCIVKEDVLDANGNKIGERAVEKWLPQAAEKTISVATPADFSAIANLIIN